MPRHQFARAMVVFWAKEYPVRFGLWIAFTDALGAGLAYWLSSEIKTDRGLIVAGAIVVGIVIALVTLFLVAFLTAPRRSLQIRVDELQEAVAQQQTTINALVQEKWGEPGDFIPIYHDLRTDMREAIRMVEQALSSGQLWPYSQDPDDRVWKNKRTPRRQPLGHGDPGLRSIERGIWTYRTNQKGPGSTTSESISQGF